MPSRGGDARAREVGTEGQLGGQAQVKGVGGTWKDLTTASRHGHNLTNQVRNIAEVTTAVANATLTKKITVDVRGEVLQLKNTITGCGSVERLRRRGDARGARGWHRWHARRPGGGARRGRRVEGADRQRERPWLQLTGQVRNNRRSDHRGGQRRSVAHTITVDAKGEILETEEHHQHTMVDQLNGFASEVTRVAREFGTEGKLGGQAQVKGRRRHLEGLTDSVNSMATNLTTQVRSIARIVTAVANGDLRRNLVLEARGESRSWPRRSTA